MTPTILNEDFRTKKKPVYPIHPGLREYLLLNDRQLDLPVTYEELLDYYECAPLMDKEGNDTLWATVIYPPEIMIGLAQELTKIYVMLKAGGELSIMNHLFVDRIDFCTFGNSNPFRIRIVNSLNDNQDYYYIKKADASRVFGLELEHLLSPNRIHYLISGDTLVEEHVVGIPGDDFIRKWMRNRDYIKPIRLAKEMVKFNERCFARLLGDMRSYNFVVDITHDFEEAQVRIRAMDFDQQSYSGRLNFYRPQFFKDNNEIVLFCLEHINKATAHQYQVEERTLLSRRVEQAGNRLKKLLHLMGASPITTPEKIESLSQSLAELHGNDKFLKCSHMGELVSQNLKTICINHRTQDSKKRHVFDL
jgi:hypothetical protein